MPRTHHATRTWRLSCGCLRDYPGMPTRRTHHVLCMACQVAATTLYAYPERRCGITAVIMRAGTGTRVRVSCTEPPGNTDCGLGVHFDKHMLIRFEAASTLRASQQGQIGRA